MDNQGNFLQQNLKITPDQLMKIVCFIQNPATSVVQKLDGIELSASKAGEAGEVPIAPPPPPLCKAAEAGEAETSMMLWTIEQAVQEVVKNKSQIRYQKYLAKQF